MATGPGRRMPVSGGVGSTHVGSAGCWLLVAGLAFGLVAGCSLGADRIELPELQLSALDSGVAPAAQVDLRCERLGDTSCIDGTYRRCRQAGPFLEPELTDCEADGLVCDALLGCVACNPGNRRCQACPDDDAECEGLVVQACKADGSGYQDEETCSLQAGNTCNESGRCVNACELAADRRSYVGCEFYAADLDNAALDVLNNAAAQQYALAVANPHDTTITVKVEVNDAAPGEALQVRELAVRQIPPNFLEVFELPQREVDGSTVGGLNDGTHTALTSNAFRLESSHPVTVYQFNPLDNVDVFSNDASLLLPTGALGSQYTVVAWPQTIGDSDDPSLDFDSTSSDEDLRSFLAILGTEAETHVTVELGTNVMAVVPGGPVPASGPGDILQHDLGPFDVLNLETAGTNADFTGTRVISDKPVSIFVGSEASDVPLFTDYSTRQCCADHLEEQLFPDRTLGTNFIIAHMPSRTAALNAAAPEGQSLGVAQVVEPERLRLVAVAPGSTRVRTTLPAPDDVFDLAERQDRTLVVDRDFRILADGAVAVLQALPSQGVTGIPRGYPGGDPAIVAIPPLEQYREDYIFLTPDKYAFDFVTVMAPATANVRLDGVLLQDRAGCTEDDLEGEGQAAQQDAGALRFEPAKVFRCQLSFPEVTPGPSSQVLPGEQDDGVHRLVASEPVGLVVYGFDNFVSYAYAGGLDLNLLF